MKEITLKKWQLGVSLFVPFLGIISPTLFFIILIAYFFFWGYVLVGKG